MTNSIQIVVDELAEVYKVADEVLKEWTGNTNLQFSALLGMMAVKLGWDEKQMREADPLVRFYVRKHPDWYVTRGAHGGIMRATEKQKKEAEKAAKASVKNQVKALIEQKLQQAAKTAPVKQEVKVDDETDVDDLIGSIDDDSEV